MKMIMIAVVLMVVVVVFMFIIYHSMNVTETELYSKTTINAIALVQDDSAAFREL